MDFIYGKQFTHEIEAFEARVKLIQAKYADFFKEQPDRITGNKPMDITNEYVIHFPPQLSIGFFKNSCIPKHIQDEVTNTFVSIFSAK